MESTVRYLGIEVDDALEMAEQTEAQWAVTGQERPLTSVSLRTALVQKL